jgi:hypothetical protein
MFKKLTSAKTFIVLFVSFLFANTLVLGSATALTLSGNGAYGISGTITSPPPSTAPTISSPTNGQSFTSVPTAVSGVCVSGLLIKIFINGIFSGSAQCVNNSYSISTDLFLGTNNIYADDYDSLNQAGPKSNTVSVTYVNNAITAGTPVTLTSDYAKLGADPGSLLTWPIQISGGTAPYALSVNWGDGTPSTLVSQASPGTVNLTHTYSVSGTYDVTINATDKNGTVAFLQVVGVANGPAAQSSGSTNSKSTTQSSGLSNLALGLIIGILVIVPPSTFWLGKMHQQKLIEAKFRNNLPFS